MRTVITIDPQTTNILRSVYLGLVPGYDVEVRSYLEVLADRSAAGSARLARDVVLHDSCVFARYEGAVEDCSPAPESPWWIPSTPAA